MSERNIERRSIEQTLDEELKTLHDIQLLRDQQEMEGLNYRVLRFEESGGIRIVSYNEYEKETVYRDLEGKEHVGVEEMMVNAQHQ